MKGEVALKKSVLARKVSTRGTEKSAKEVMLRFWPEMLQTAETMDVWQVDPRGVSWVGTFTSRKAKLSEVALESVKGEVIVKEMFD